MQDREHIAQLAKMAAIQPAGATHQGQWWSIILTHRRHLLQWWARGGRTVSQRLHMDQSSIPTSLCLCVCVVCVCLCACVMYVCGVCVCVVRACVVCVWCMCACTCVYIHVCVEGRLSNTQVKRLSRLRQCPNLCLDLVHSF